MKTYLIDLGKNIQDTKDTFNGQNFKNLFEKYKKITN